MTRYILDGKRMQTRDAMHDVLQEVFSAPSYYGRNLDALHDVLSEFCHPFEILFRNPECMPQSLFPSLAAVLLNLCRDNPDAVLSFASDTLVPGRYRHFKGREYRLLHIALHSETLEPMVVYQADYGSRGIWVRPAAMWSERLTRDGVEIQRFTLIDSE